ncbi:MAG TPA: S-methyl-5'-thioadenosine phosphorylase, partial [Terriglobia bacterium]|nr:S-methyl-5'-thioadenosine phosphorylase [Terriglobia bacterium]
MSQAEIGIIGGSGIYQMEGLKRKRAVRVATPFGKPSDTYVLGELEGRQVAFLARHGKGHVLLPSELNFRANIYGFKKLGAERIVALSAVGSLREDIRPMDMAIP